MPSAGEVLGIWSHRLNMNRRGVTKQWTPALRQSVEHLVESLRALDPTEETGLEVDLSRSPIAKFIRSRTGEVLGEIDLSPIDTAADPQP